MRNAPLACTLEHLLPRWWQRLGRLWNFQKVSHWVSFEGFTDCSHSCSVDRWNEISHLAPATLPCLPHPRWILLFRNHELLRTLSPPVALVMVFCHRNREVSNNASLICIICVCQLNIKSKHDDAGLRFQNLQVQVWETFSFRSVCAT